MKKAAIIVLILALEISVGAQQPAFPDAEGAGKWALGGRGGVVYEVTNLNNSGPGSLRAAVEASGKRIVVFRVSGNIELTSKLIISNPYITIAGQTAPGDGICLKRYPLIVRANHVIVRYIRCRLSDEAVGDPNYPTGGEGMDSLCAERGHNIIFDHCSASWSIDETLSVSVQSGSYDLLGNVTVQWCIISESLDCANAHAELCHGNGTLAKGGWGNEYTFHHNLYAHHASRSPYPGNYNTQSIDPQGLIFDFRNNVVYNWRGRYAGYSTPNGTCYVTKINFVDNYYKPGPESGDSSGTVKAFCEGLVCSKGYFSGNWMDTDYPLPWSLVDFAGFTADQISAFKQASEIPVSNPVPPEDAETAFVRVLDDAGATLPKRDPVDERIVKEVINWEGGIIDDEMDVNGWPELHSAPPPIDSDRDGMPNEWEIARGLNPNSASDGAWDRDGDGYTNIEEYLNYIVLRGENHPDFDDDDDIDIDDLAIFGANWLQENCDQLIVGNLSDDCSVNLRDFAFFAQDWLDGVITGTTYYVATNGSNANPGTEEQPWATIQKAADTMVAGDKVVVKPGTYLGMVVPANSGLKKASITYIADPSGEVIIDAGGNYYALSVSVDWIVIDGFKIRGALSEGISINMAGTGNKIVQNCKICNNGGDGICITSTEGVQIKNSLIYSNSGVGVSTYNICPAFLADNCTICGNGGSGLQLDGDGSIIDCIITNNNNYGIQSDSGHTVSYSDVFDNSAGNYSPGINAGTGCISADPCFVDRLNGDFHLGFGSPCIGTASDGGDMGYRY